MFCYVDSGNICDNLRIKRKLALVRKLAIQKNTGNAKLAIRNNEWEIQLVIHREQVLHSIVYSRQPFLPTDVLDSQFNVPH